MTEKEVGAAAGLIVEDNKISKLTGTVLSAETNRYDVGGPEITLTIALDGGVYSKSGGPLNRMDLVDASEVKQKVKGVKDTIAKWRLPGVSNLDDIKKAPKEIAKLILGAITRITLDARIGRALVEYVDALKSLGAGESVLKANQSKSAFIAVLAYDALRFTPEEIEDEAGSENIIRENLKTLQTLKADKSLSVWLRNAISDIEKDAITRG